MEVYCTAPYWANTGDLVGLREGGAERTNLKTLNYSYERFIVYGRKGVVGRRDGRRGNWLSATVLLEIAPCYFSPGGGNPGGQFLIQPVQLDVQYVNSDYCTYLESQNLQVENSKRNVILHRWLRVVCYFHASPPGPWIQHNYSRQAGQAGAFKGTLEKRNCVNLFCFVTALRSVCQLFFCGLVK